MISCKLTKVRVIVYYGKEYARLQFDCLIVLIIVARMLRFLRNETPILAFCYVSDRWRALPAERFRWEGKTRNGTPNLCGWKI